MSKHRRFKELLSGFTAALFISIAFLYAPVAAQYSSDSYGACAYGETCAVATTDDAASDLSNTGENQKLFLYGALILIGAAVVTYTIKHKRSYKLKS